MSQANQNDLYALLKGGLEYEEGKSDAKIKLTLEKIIEETQIQQKYDFKQRHPVYEHKF